MLMRGSVVDGTAARAAFVSGMVATKELIQDETVSSTEESVSGCSGPRSIKDPYCERRGLCIERCLANEGRRWAVNGCTSNANVISVSAEPVPFV